MIQVFHNDKFLAYEMTNTVNLKDLTLVAEVDTNDLEEAFKLTNHIDCNWSDNKTVKTINPSRSTSMGDVLVKDNQRYVVSDFGFEKLSNGRYNRYYYNPSLR